MGQAATMAVDEINQQGGLLGSPIELIFIDNKSTSLGSKHAAMEAVQRQVTGVIGASWSSHSLAMAPVLQKAKIPMITPVSTNPKVTEIGDYIFRVCFTDELQAKTMARFARKDLNAATAVVLHNINEQYSITLGDFFTHWFIKDGGTVLFQGNYTAKSVDFTEMLTKVKELAPDVVFIPGYSRDCALVVRQAVEMGITTTFLGGDDWDTKSFLSKGGKKLKKGYYCTHWSPASQSPVSLAFVDKLKKKKKLTSAFALSHDAVFLLANAMIRAGSMARKKIRNALKETTAFEGITGKIVFDKNRNPVKNAVINEINNGKIRYFETIFP